MLVHATCVAVAGRALLIRGPSGSGKSALALDMIALGAGLIADDQVALRRVGDALHADHPHGADGQATALIEARGLGLLHLPRHGPAPVVAVLDLGGEAPARLPAHAVEPFLGVAIDRMAAPCPPGAAAICLMLRHWPRLDPDGGAAE